MTVSLVPPSTPPTQTPAPLAASRQQAAPRVRWLVSRPAAAADRGGLVSPAPQVQRLHLLAGMRRGPDFGEWRALQRESRLASGAEQHSMARAPLAEQESPDAFHAGYDRGYADALRWARDMLRSRVAAASAPVLLDLAQPEPNETGSAHSLPPERAG